MPTVTANGLRTNYQLLPGSGEPTETVVFIHGLGTDSLASFHLTLAAPVAAAGIDVLSYDLRGHGHSDRPRSGYTVGTFTDDLHDLLLQLDIRDPVHLVGNSFGGTVAYLYALRHPDRVRSIVCIESEPPTEDWAQRMTEVLDNTVRFLGEESSYAWIEANFGAHHRRLARMAAARIQSTTLPAEVPLGPLMSLADVSGIDCPVLSLLGSHGYQAADLDALTALLPRGERVVFDGQGHSVLVERHRQVRGLVLDWVARHSGAAVR